MVAPPSPTAAGSPRLKCARRTPPATTPTRPGSPEAQRSLSPAQLAAAAEMNAAAALATSGLGGRTGSALFTSDTDTTPTAPRCLPAKRALTPGSSPTARAEKAPRRGRAGRGGARGRRGGLGVEAGAAETPSPNDRDGTLDGTAAGATDAAGVGGGSGGQTLSGEDDGTSDDAASRLLGDELNAYFTQGADGVAFAPGETAAAPRDAAGGSALELLAYGGTLAETPGVGDGGLAFDGGRGVGAPSLGEPSTLSIGSAAESLTVSGAVGGSEPPVVYDTAQLGIAEGTDFYALPPFDGGAPPAAVPSLSATCAEPEVGRCAGPPLAHQQQPLVQLPTPRQLPAGGGSAAELPAELMRTPHTPLVPSRLRLVSPDLGSSDGSAVGALLAPSPTDGSPAGSAVKSSPGDPSPAVFASGSSPQGTVACVLQAAPDTGAGGEELLCLFDAEAGGDTFFGGVLEGGASGGVSAGGGDAGSGLDGGSGRGELASLGMAGEAHAEWSLFGSAETTADTAQGS